MQIDNNISSNTERKTLKDFTPLVFAFFGSLVVLSIYQNLRLYFSGVLDSFLNKSFLLLILHHTGFTALVALLLAFLFNFLENRKPGGGYKVVRIVLLILLGVEGLLIAYYVQNYEILGIGIYGVSSSESIRFFMLPIALMLMATALIFHRIRKVTASLYKVISRMYPFTIILFSLFLATLNTDKKPINENKTQHLLSSIASNLFEFNTYKGEAEFPLLKAYKPNNTLGKHFNLGGQKPNIVFIVAEGLGADFIGENAKFSGFTPGLDSIAKKSLYWKNFVSNTGTGFASLPVVMGSLPFGENGFTNVTEFTNRHTLFSILKENGYTTSFNYGGNSALNRLDKFLDEEQVDQILDRNSFGPEFQLQEEDDAGVSLGYPDEQLFKKWETLTSSSNEPKLEVFLTLSTKNPYLIPDNEVYENQVEELLPALKLSDRSKKLVDKNSEIFASLLYTDQAISNFIRAYQKRPEYTNTIFIITGSHSLTDLPKTDDLGRYRVPFLVYSPLVKNPYTFTSLASHADIAPTLISVLDETYDLEVPKQVAWLGNSLIEMEIFKASKQIPLFRDVNNIQDFILGKHYLSGKSMYELDDHLNLLESENDGTAAILEENFKSFKAINKYVTENNKIIPQSAALMVASENTFSKTDMIWVESVFNGKDIDNAYNTARKLAFDKDWERSLLLCRYILSQTPRHADTQILMGRVYSWQEDYDASEKVLKEAIRKYPKYDDAYAALLDTYHWSENHTKAIRLLETIRNRNLKSDQLNEKIKRAENHISKEPPLTANTDFEQ